MSIQNEHKNIPSLEVEAHRGYQARMQVLVLPRSNANKSNLVVVSTFPTKPTPVRLYWRCSLCTTQNCFSVRHLRGTVEGNQKLALATLRMIVESIASVASTSPPAICSDSPASARPLNPAFVPVFLQGIIKVLSGTRCGLTRKSQAIWETGRRAVTLATKETIVVLANVISDIIPDAWLGHAPPRLAAIAMVVGLNILRTTNENITLSTCRSDIVNTPEALLAKGAFLGGRGGGDSNFELIPVIVVFNKIIPRIKPRIVPAGDVFMTKRDVSEFCDDLNLSAVMLLQTDDPTIVVGSLFGRAMSPQFLHDPQRLILGTLAGASGDERWSLVVKTGPRDNEAGVRLRWGTSESATSSLLCNVTV
ncbi:hypothetical protein BJV77DRAFT_1122948 [Russula vinacea]|nr:hypothetical protein BJV77DRAFT_1122948 [Russula vinacea]